ncbi:hypothetical protein AGLY_011020 [Aphis glycines]|uniref:Uncharacterized protein n=1 Tax=Aphis glycines TaxID=307491 RepID=A0A6G0TCV6_APHGL|nr:hypothetical protein AGLY_011020 [Aphis glycines]
MEECLVHELVLDRINLSNLNYLCCLTPDIKVKKLWLRFCQLKDKGVNYLLDILDETSGKTQLNSLYLDCNGITCEGAKKIAQILRTNRTLKSLSLARNLIKDEGAFALMSVLSKFQLNSDEIDWKSTQEQKSNRILEYLMDILAQKLKEKNSPSNDSINCAGLTSIEYNRFSSNILSVIEQIFHYQQKVCMAKEGLRNIKIEGFDKKQIERINKLIEGKLRLDNRSKKFR